MNKDLFECNETYRIEKNENGELNSYKTIAIKKYLGNDNIVTIPEEINNISVTVIGSECFKDREDIEEVILPSTINSIERDAFKNCINLKKINLENVNYIDNGAFSNTKIEKVIINKIEEISSFAFFECTELKEVIIKENLKIINTSAFENCKKLNRVEVPETLEKINEAAFRNCKKITSINLSKKVKTKTTSFDKKILEIINNKTNVKVFNIETLLKETKKMKKEEIENYIKELIKSKKLDNFDTSDITNMNDIKYDKKTGQLSWKCTRCGVCTCDLWDIVNNKGKMINSFNISGCGYCK